MNVIAVLQLTTTTISVCYHYGNGVKNASKDKKMITEELRRLQKVLEDVCELVQDEEAKAASRLPTLFSLLEKPGGLPHCRDELESLKAQLEPKVRRSTVTQLLVWPFKEGAIRQTLDNIAQFKELLVSALNVDQTYAAHV